MQKSVIFILILLFDSCVEDKSFKTTYYSSGERKEEYFYTDNDTLKDGVVKTYFRSGELQSESYYEMGVLEGDKTAYFKTGQVKERMALHNGKINGRYYAYFDDGQLKSDMSIVKGVKVGKALTYYETGLLQYYVFSNTLGDVVYIREYDGNGNLLKVQGKPMAQIIFINQRLAPGETLTVEMYLANPPDMAYELLAGEIDIEGYWMEPLYPQQMPIDSTLVVYTQQFEQVGTHIWSYILMEKDLKTDSVREYYQSIPIYVEE